MADEKSPGEFGQKPRIVVAIVVMVAFVLALLLVEIHGPAPAPTPVRSERQVQGSGCTTVQIFIGNRQSPYWRFAGELATQIKAALRAGGAPQPQVLPQVTAGGADNLYRLEENEAGRCGVAIAKLNVAVDATYGVYQFLPGETPGVRPPQKQNPIRGLRTVGPVFDDLLQIAVADQPGAPRTVEELCGRPLSVGFPLSGSRQVTEVFYRKLCPNTPLRVKEESLKEGFAHLGSGREPVDAILWVNAAPTDEIAQQLQNHKARLLDIPQKYIEKMNENWRVFYQEKAGEEYIDQKIFREGVIFRDDYLTSGNYETVAVPAGLVVRDSADTVLVTALARILTGSQSRQALTEAMWGRAGVHSKLANVATDIGDRQYGISSLFCYVPLHPAAETVYRDELGYGLPDCAKR
ncbi:hypothetical protein MXD61_26655 [Frankia sp. AgPm24]|uniref:TAXI family TRAP transporter solute-binding subunit n=1 Tax=Frankia sp. AgPm24 TaxID=631128 RepID=UPI00200BC930|nr:TAXI family TRAP transporter solute-binding subunit [Frankia sp. AgPm24]MCK9925410.1 hypothetical protein [Frankia sp. AgPm24]